MVLDNTLKHKDCIENMQVLIDHVEINAMMPIKSELDDISDLTDRYQMVAFSMLYCGICPPSTLIVFIYFIIDNTLTRYMDMYWMQRPIQVF